MGECNYTYVTSHRLMRRSRRLTSDARSPDAAYADNALWRSVGNVNEVDDDEIVGGTLVGRSATYIGRRTMQVSKRGGRSVAVSTEHNESGNYTTCFELKPPSIHSALPAMLFSSSRLVYRFACKISVPVATSIEY